MSLLKKPRRIFKLKKILDRRDDDMNYFEFPCI